MKLTDWFTIVTSVEKLACTIAILAHFKQHNIDTEIKFPHFTCTYSGASKVKIIAHTNDNYKESLSNVNYVLGGFVV